MRFIIIFYFLLSMNSYAATSTCRDLNKELPNRVINTKRCIELPYMKEGYIPQGVHVTSTNLAYVSMYHKDKYGNSSKNSIVAEISLEDETYRKWELPTKSHVGGVAIFDNYSKFVVPDGKEFCIYSISPNIKKHISGLLIDLSISLKNALTKHCQVQSVRSSTKTTGFSFIHYAPDQKGNWYMWSGQFEVGRSSNDGMHIFGYRVKAGNISTSPSYRFYVPPSVNKIQGVSVIAPKSASDDYRILVSSSYGDHRSSITLLNYKREETYHYKYKYHSNRKVYDTPAGLEEIHATAHSKSVWTTFESGSEYYDNKWDSMGFPFLLKIPFWELGLD